MRFLIGNIIAVLTVAVLFAGCGKAPQSNSDGKLRITCGLPPISYIAKVIANDKAEVVSLLPSGRSPHDYSPRPADIRDAGKSAFFFTTGMNFEKSAVRALPSKVRIMDVSKNIKRRHFDDGHGSCDGHGHDHDHHGEEALDPHVWLSPANAEKIAENISGALCELDPENSTVYKENLRKFVSELAGINGELAKRLAPYAKRTILVYHPAFGYFTDSFDLKQHPLEINGREMTAVQLAAVIKKAKEEDIRLVFVQPQFNPRTAKELASRIDGVALPLDPLEYDLIANFRKMGEAICRGFGEKK